MRVLHGPLVVDRHGIAGRRHLLLRGRVPRERRLRVERDAVVVAGSAAALDLANVLANGARGRAAAEDALERVGPAVAELEPAARAQAEHNHAERGAEERDAAQHEVERASLGVAAGLAHHARVASAAHRKARLGVVAAGAQIRRVIVGSDVTVRADDAVAGIPITAHMGLMNVLHRRAHGAAARGAERRAPRLLDAVLPLDARAKEPPAEARRNVPRHKEEEPVKVRPLDVAASLRDHQRIGATRAAADRFLGVTAVAEAVRVIAGDWLRPLVQHAHEAARRGRRRLRERRRGTLFRCNKSRVLDRRRARNGRVRRLATHGGHASPYVEQEYRADEVEDEGGDAERESRRICFRDVVLHFRRDSGVRGKRSNRQDRCAGS
eukprot:Opistho-1_new@61210